MPQENADADGYQRMDVPRRSRQGPVPHQTAHARPWHSRSGLPMKYSGSLRTVRSSTSRMPSMRQPQEFPRPERDSTMSSAYSASSSSTSTARVCM
jgi:hypothetical protein